WVKAPVLSQPSLPVGLTPRLRRAIHLSPEDVARLRRRMDEEQLKVLGLRFTADALCGGSRFRTLRERLGPGFEGIEISSFPGNPHGIAPVAHSVVTTDLVDEAGHPTRQALERVLGFFREALLEAPAAPGAGV